MSYFSILGNRRHFHDDDGSLLVGGYFNAYVAGTFTATDTWTDISGTVKNTAKIILNNRGEIESGGMFGDNSIAYKVVLHRSDDSTVWTEDNLTGLGTGAGLINGFVTPNHIPYSGSDQILSDSPASYNPSAGFNGEFDFPRPTLFSSPAGVIAQTIYSQDEITNARREIPSSTGYASYINTHSFTKSITDYTNDASVYRGIAINLGGGASLSHATNILDTGDGTNTLDYVDSGTGGGHVLEFVNATGARIEVKRRDGHGLYTSASVDGSGGLYSSFSNGTRGIYTSIYAASATHQIQNIQFLDSSGDIGTTGHVLSADSNGYLNWITKTEAATDIDWVDFLPQSVIPAWKEGRVFYDENTHCLTVYNDISDTSLQVGLEQWIRARNMTGGTLLNGKCVYVSGAVGQTPTIELFQNTVQSPYQIVGVLTENIDNTKFGWVTIIGEVHNMDTSALTEGAAVYASSTIAGDLTSTAPTSGPVTQVGVCLYQHAVNGTLLVKTADATAYQEFITAGISAQYYRGDKTWQTLNTGAVPESTNLYYTDARAVAAMTGAISTVTTFNLTADRLVVSNGSGKIAASTVTTANLTDLTDGGDSTLHYHAADRARANHTGTQLAATISDFTSAAQTAVAGIYLPLTAGAGSPLTGLLHANAGINTTTMDASTSVTSKRVDLSRIDASNGSLISLARATDNGTRGYVGFPATSTALWMLQTGGNNDLVIANNSSTTGRIRIGEADAFDGTLDTTLMTLHNTGVTVSVLLTASNGFSHAGNLGFYGTTPTTKPTISGSRGGNAALASLLTGLAGLGLVTDSTTA